MKLEERRNADVGTGYQPATQGSINLPPELVQKARKLGLNIPKIAENALILAVQKGGNLGTVGFGLVRGIDTFSRLNFSEKANSNPFRSKNN